MQSRHLQLPTVHLSQFWVIKLARWLAGQIPDLTTGVSIPCRILGKLSDVGISFSLRDVGTYQQVKATAWMYLGRAVESGVNQLEVIFLQF